MKDSLFIKICLILIIVLLAVNLFFQNRYDMYVVQTHPEDIYKSDYAIKLDKWTGRIWYLPILGQHSGKIMELGIIKLDFPKEP
jgi:hypothetical protein